MSLANDEKNRVEEKQRARRREYEEKNIIHKPRWFDIQLNQKSK